MEDQRFADSTLVPRVSFLAALHIKKQTKQKKPQKLNTVAKKLLNQSCPMSCIPFISLFSVVFSDKVNLDFITQEVHAAFALLLMHFNTLCI